MYTASTPTDQMNIIESTVEDQKDARAPEKKRANTEDETSQSHIAKRFAPMTCLAEQIKNLKLQEEEPATKEGMDQSITAINARLEVIKKMIEAYAVKWDKEVAREQKKAAKRRQYIQSTSVLHIAHEWVRNEIYKMPEEKLDFELPDTSPEAGGESDGVFKYSVHFHREPSTEEWIPEFLISQGAPPEAQESDEEFKDSIYYQTFPERALKSVDLKGDNHIISKVISTTNLREDLRNLSDTYKDMSYRLKMMTLKFEKQLENFKKNLFNTKKIDIAEAVIKGMEEMIRERTVGHLYLLTLAEVLKNCYLKEIHSEASPSLSPLLENFPLIDLLESDYKDVWVQDPSTHRIDQEETLKNIKTKIQELGIKNTSILGEASVPEVERKVDLLHQLMYGLLCRTRTFDRELEMISVSQLEPLTTDDWNKWSKNVQKKLHHLNPAISDNADCDMAVKRWNRRESFMKKGGEELFSWSSFESGLQIAGELVNMIGAHYGVAEVTCYEDYKVSMLQIVAKSLEEARVEPYRKSKESREYSII